MHFSCVTSTLPSLTDLTQYWRHDYLTIFNSTKSGFKSILTVLQPLSTVYNSSVLWYQVSGPCWQCRVLCRQGRGREEGLFWGQQGGWKSYSSSFYSAFCKQIWEERMREVEGEVVGTWWLRGSYEEEWRELYCNSWVRGIPAIQAWKKTPIKWLRRASELELCVCVCVCKWMFCMSISACVSVCGAAFWNVGLRSVCHSLCAYTCSLLWYWGRRGTWSVAMVL